MPVNAMEILKKHLESNIGDLGTKIFDLKKLLKSSMVLKNQV